MEKLVITIMGQNCDRFIGMCLDSLEKADAIVYCDGGSKDKTFEKINEKLDILTKRGFNVNNWDYIYHEYEQSDIGMNGKQRNFYLNHLKENYKDYWALCLDADELVYDLNEIKKFIQTAKSGMYSVKMRHLIGDLGNEDATMETHYVPHRLFKIHEKLFYPEVEHPVLSYKEFSDTCGYVSGLCDATTIWHLAYIPNMWEIKKRYENHMKKSNMHTPEFLKRWYYSHLFGQYPKRQIDLLDLPVQLLKEFGIDKDEFYFANRGIEIKHPIMVKEWNEYFKPKSVLDLGCGRGPYLFFWKWYVEDIHGIELSEWAVKNPVGPRVFKGDITKGISCPFTPELITCIDVLEHLDEEGLKNALTFISKIGNRFLFSVPVIGDPNLNNDKTHKQFKKREEWIKLWESYGIQILETPKDWLFSQQLFVGRKI